MDLYTLAVLGHLIGTVLGVGGATMIEIQLGKSLKDGTMSPDERSLLGSDFFTTRIGLVLSVITGLYFIYNYFVTSTLFRIESGVFWAKMAFIVVIIVNSYLLHKHKIGLYWGSAFSFVSWWTVFVLGFFLSHTIKVVPTNAVVEFFALLVIYGVLLVSGAWILHTIRERIKSTHAGVASVAAPTHEQSSH